MNVLLVLFTAFAAGALPAPTDLSDAVSVYRDVEFVRYGGRGLALDLYVPRAATGPVPCIVVIAGGGFRPQQQQRFGDTARAFAETGFAAASISYRGWPEDPFPAAVHDAKAAVRFVRARANDFGIDPARIGAFGQSAGGHLAAMLAVTDDKELEGEGGHGDVSSAVQAAVSFAGVFDLIERFRETNTAENKPEKRQTNGQWIGEPYSPDSPQWRLASPFYHVTPGDAPMLLVHCKDDQTVAWTQSQRMFDAMEAVVPACRLLLFEEGGHNVRGDARVKARAWSDTLEFFRETLSAR